MNTGKRSWARQEKRYDYEKLGMQFVVKGDVEAKNEQSANSVVIYPAENAYTKASIWIQQSERKGLIDVRSQLQTDCKYYFSQKKKTRYLSRPAEKNWGAIPLYSVGKE